MSVKRLAKRSIVGMRVSALSEDGFYYPSLIFDIKYRSPSGETVYEVVDEGDRSHREVTAAQIIGQGFAPACTAHLKFSQPVFVTVDDGREVRAIVQKHRKQTNEVLLKTADEMELDFKVKLDDVRLLESRKASRVISEHGSEMQRLSEMISEPKKRPVSTCIEVPSVSPSAKSQKIHESEPPMDDVMAAMVLTSLSGTSPLIQRERNPSGDSVLSIGPMSPASSHSSGYGNVSPSPSPSTNLHFTWEVASRSTPSPASSGSDMEGVSSPYPFNTAQGSVPVSTGNTALFSSSLDEGIDISSDSPPFHEDKDAPCSPTKKFKPSVKTSYKCTWQGCGKTLSTVQGIERHIRTIHLRKKDGEEYSDHEEEFYYTEIDTTVESVSDTLANMCTSSTPPTAFPFDHAHLKKQLHKHQMKQQLQQQLKQEQARHNTEGRSRSATHPLPMAAEPVALRTSEELSAAFEASTPSLISRLPHMGKSPPRSRHYSGPCGFGSVVPATTSRVEEAPTTVGSLPNQAATMMAPSSSIPSMPQFSWYPTSSSPSSFNFSSCTSSQPSQASHNRVRHKSAPAHGQPKIRSEGKKCRKVYGMENRDLWCTQCRWKKACVRFT